MYSLRPANATDSIFVYHLHRSTMRDYVDQTWGWDEDFQARVFKQWFDPTRFQIVVVDGENVGLLAVERRPAELFLGTLEILPAYQRQGLGTEVIRSILSQAKTEGLPVALTVLKVNPARELYARLGFSVVGETPTHYLMRTPEPASPA